MKKITNVNLMRQFMKWLSNKSYEERKLEDNKVRELFEYKCANCHSNTDRVVYYNKLEKLNNDSIENKFLLCSKCSMSRLGKSSYIFFKDNKKALKLINSKKVKMNYIYNNEIIDFTTKQFIKITRILPEDILELKEDELMTDKRIQRVFIELEREYPSLIKGNNLETSKYKKILTRSETSFEIDLNLDDEGFDYE